jgi:predicted 2-oxoglutarate/Fe(II)-dependent dioxygenase YbiX
MLPSSRGLGHPPFTQVTRVRISLGVPINPISIVMNIIKNALTIGACKQIIWRGCILGKLVESWHTVEQYSTTVEVQRMFIGRYIKDILKSINFELPNTASVELLRYNTGSGNELHIDYQGPHKIGKEITNAVWRQTGVILLNTDFEGGVLAFPKQRAKFTKESQGDLILFPAGKGSVNFAHTVSTITKGTRYSLVIRFL